MSTIQLVAVTLIYMVPVALVALLLTTDRRRRLAGWLITAVLLALPVFYVSHYFLLQQMQGWPSSASLPQQFRLLAFDITEPDPNADKAGRILLWISAADSDQPRVHRLAYRKDLHQELVAAGQRQAKGRPQLGTRSQRAMSTNSGPTRGSQDSVSFRDANARSLPPKP